MLGKTIFQMQGKLHSTNGFVLPCALMLSASALLLYSHVSDSESSDPVKKFLFMILLQMLPLVIVETKIMSCLDPVAALSNFGPKVMLMHVAFLTVRVIGLFAGTPGASYWHVVHLIAACIVLCKGLGFRLSLRSVIANRDVLCLVLLAVVAAVFTEGLEMIVAWEYKKRSFFRMKKVLRLTLAASADYMEVLALVPAVWMVYQKETQSSSVLESMWSSPQVDSDPRKRTLCLFAFLLGFYFIEDVVSAVTYRSYLFIAGGHLVHYFLLLDCAGYILAHLYDPEKLKGQLLRWLPDSCASIAV